jgi:hypothetical protein
VSSLIEEFNKEIGPKSPTQEGSSHFGIRVIKDELMLLRHKLPSRLGISLAARGTTGRNDERCHGGSVW